MPKETFRAKHESRRQLRRIYLLGRPHFGRILSCLLLILAATGLQLTLPQGIRHIFDQMLDSRDTGLIHLVALVLLVVFIFRSFLTFAGQFILQTTGDAIVVELRDQLFRKLHSLDLDYHHRQRVGDLLSRLSNDVGAIRNIVAELSISLIVSFSLLLGAATVMLLMNWRLGIIVLMVAPLASLVSIHFGRTLQTLSARIQNELARSNVIAQESLSGMEVIKGFARAPREAQRYRRALTRFMSVAIKTRRVDAFFNALVGFLMSAAIIVIFWFGGIEVIAGSLSAGTLVAFLLYSQNVTQSVGAIAQHYASFRQSMGASSRVFEILDIAPDLQDKPGAVEFTDDSVAIDFQNVSFEYRKGEPVLRDIDLRIESGQTVALVGHSGAGKSTLLKLVPRFYDPSHGCLRINGRDLRDYRMDSLREAIAIVSQDVFLFGTSIRENIRYGRLDASDAEVEQAARAANAHEFIERLPNGYDTRVGERGLQLSGGQRQRVSIARALLKNAPILLLDEATSSVDTASETLIQQAIDRLHGNRTTLIIAHRQATVRNADQIIVLSGGVIVARPSYDDLCTDTGDYFESLRQRYLSEEKNEENS